MQQLLTASPAERSRPTQPAIKQIADRRTHIRPAHTALARCRGVDGTFASAEMLKPREQLSRGGTVASALNNFCVSTRL